MHNIERRPRVSVHFNSDPKGGDLVVVNGVATLAHDRPASAQPGYSEKYGQAITGEIGMTMAAFEPGYSTRIRITTGKVRLTSG